MAVQRGELPVDFFQSATRREVVVETPLAPRDRLCLAGARYWGEANHEEIELDTAANKATAAAVRARLCKQTPDDAEFIEGGLQAAATRAVERFIIQNRAP